VIAKPSSSRNEVVGFDNDKNAWLITIKTAAEDGKANWELLKFLRKETGKQWMIKSGLTGHKKILVALG